MKNPKTLSILSVDNIGRLVDIGIPKTETDIPVAAFNSVEFFISSKTGDKVPLYHKPSVISGVDYTGFTVEL